MTHQIHSNSTRLASLGRDAFNFFEQVLQIFTEDNPSDRLSPQNHSSFLREYERFKIWAVDLGLLVPGHGSLDYRLREAESLARTFETHLSDLNRYLEETTVFGDSKKLQAENVDAILARIENISEGEQDNEAAISEDDSEDEEHEPQWYIDLLLASVIDVIDHLFRLSTLIRNPSRRLASSKAKLFQHIDEDSGVDLINAFGHYDHDYVLSVFRDYQSKVPDEIHQQNIGALQTTDHDAETWHSVENCTLCKSGMEIAEEISSINPDDQNSGQNSVGGEGIAPFLIHRIARANILRRQQFGYWKEHRGKLVKHTELALEQRRPATRPVDHNVSKDFDMGNKGGERTVLKLTDLLAPPTVTTATTLQPTSISLTDNKSVTSVSEYAPSDWGPGREVVEFPPPPKRPAGEKFFECPYCFTICPRQMLTEKAWKAHLIHDLRPYICTYPACKTASQLYDTRRAWIEHENSFHRKQWRCPDHVDLLYPSIDAYVEHIKTEHENEAMFLCSEIHLRASESFSSAADRPCPICFFSPTDTKSLQSHLASHLERLALFSLPRSTDDDEADNGEAESAVAVGEVQYSRDGDSESSVGLGDEWDNLLEAVDIGDNERVQFILRNGDGDESSHATELEHALIKAAGGGQLGIVRTLLDHGVNIEARGPYEHWERTPLMAASAEGRVDVVRLLCDRGADIDACNESESALVSASEKGHIDVVRLLLDKGASVDKSGEHGRTPLFQAAAEGHDEVVRLLLYRGANINAVADESPLQAASISGRETVVDILLNAGADVNWKHTYTALQVAAEMGRDKILKKLLEAGADPNARGTEGTTALILAAGEGEADTVRLLLEAGADINGANAQNETALHLASRKGHEAVVKLLIEAGADLEKSNKRSGTAIQAARKTGHANIVQILRNAGASEQPKDYHMDDLIQYGPVTKPKMSNPSPPTLPRSWTIQLHNDKAENLNLSLVHDIAQDSVVACVNFSRDGRYLAVGLCRSARIFDLEDMSNVTELEHGSADDADLFVRSVCFSPDGKFLLTGAGDLTLRLWEVETHQLKRAIPGYSMDIYAVAFSQDGRIFASASGDGDILLYDCDTGSNISRFTHDEGATSVSFSPDGRYVAVGGLDKKVCLISLEEERLFRLPQDYGHQDSVISVAFSRSGDKIFSASLDRTILCWGLVTDSDDWYVWTREMTGHEDYVLSVAETGDAQWIVSGSRDKTVRIWSSDTGEPQATLKGHKNSVVSVATCPSKRLIATGSGDMTFTIWGYD
ncbi:uncharacterized protein Z518_09696 [Rhinocladiella mackenziei CBS 650.93]|uniref:protein S-acyltransferase n=1 Tax=Rhinocladiella mackenziei CBS 650.93 TaxID=1442369 RepID=A0A0D2IBG9_9EURO|nr:uncharacterized protein Z518_09696 [Rhinocladiella mackenziei CBS 650.93]KIX00631.1 hypothetical protein Z518_09696 [Rhinocladiella mackenziei CBS 650.93]